MCEITNLVYPSTGVKDSTVAHSFSALFLKFIISLLLQIDVKSGHFLWKIIIKTQTYLRGDHPTPPLRPGSFCLFAGSLATLTVEGAITRGFHSMHTSAQLLLEWRTVQLLYCGDNSRVY